MNPNVTPQVLLYVNITYGRKYGILIRITVSLSESVSSVLSCARAPLLGPSSFSSSLQRSAVRRRHPVAWWVDSPGTRPLSVSFRPWFPCPSFKSIVCCSRQLARHDVSRQWSIVVAPYVLVVPVKKLWSCRHSSPRRGYNNVVVHSTELVVNLISRRLILELHENMREVRATIARSSTGCLNWEPSSPSQLSNRFDRGEPIYYFS